MFKIGFDAKRAFHNPTGLGSYARVSIESILQYSPYTEIFLFTPKFPVQKPGHFLKNSKVWDAYHFENIPNQKNVYQHKYYPQLKLVVSGWNSKIMQNWWRRFGVKKPITDLNLDVFHGLSNEIPSNLSGSVKTATTIHDIIFLKYPEQYKWFDRCIYKRKTFHALRNSDLIIFTSQATLLDVHNLGSIPLKQRKKQLIETVHYQPIKSIFDKLHWKPNTNIPYFVYHSSFNSRKNHIRLIDAFYEYLQSNNENISVKNLLLIGSGTRNEIDKINHKIADYNLNKNVTIISNCNDTQLVEYLVNSAGFIYPSLFEGFGIPLFEAASCGVPISISDIDVFQEFKKYLNGVYFFNPFQIGEMKQALMKLNTMFEVSTIKSVDGLDFENRGENIHYASLLKLIDRRNYAEQLIEYLKNGSVY